MTGVIGHIPNPTRRDVAALAAASERGGAAWLGLADAFWWRDVWVLLEAAAAATTALTIGPAMTNPYLRHPFHTVSALATLHEAAPGRVFCGIAAGGSEITAAAGISRADAGERVGELVSLIRAVVDGHPLDPESGRTLDLSLPPTQTMVAGRGPSMLRAAGEHADKVLLWAIPNSDLDRTVDVIRRAGERVGRTRPSPGRPWSLMRTCLPEAWDTRLSTRPSTPRLRRGQRGGSTTTASTASGGRWWVGASTTPSPWCRPRPCPTSFSAPTTWTPSRNAPRHSASARSPCRDSPWPRSRATSTGLSRSSDGSRA